MKTVLSLLVALILSAAPALAQEAQTQPGLWRVNTQTLLQAPSVEEVERLVRDYGPPRPEGKAAAPAGKPAAPPPQSAQVPPATAELLAALQRQKVFAPSTRDICVTREQVESHDFYQASPREGCTVSNVQRKGGTVTSDVSCAGASKIKGFGSSRFVLEGADRYTLSSTFVAVDASGRGIRTVLQQSGQWLGSDCGAVKPIAQTR